MQGGSGPLRQALSRCFGSRGASLNRARSRAKVVNVIAFDPGIFSDVSSRVSRRAPQASVRSVASRITVVMIPPVGPTQERGRATLLRRTMGDGRYFTTTPQAMRAPAFPAGSVFMSSAAA